MPVHPADAVRKKTAVGKRGCSITLLPDQTYPDVSVLHMYFFIVKKLTQVKTAVEQRQDLCVAGVRVSECSPRPKWWPLHEPAVPTDFGNARVPSDLGLRWEHVGADSEVEDDVETNYGSRF